ncbi:hypothetical protein IDH44_25485, partial [Paenibacillus sp. IB182496]|nr:hypothetical protein [Paenibacillus sabuli]
MTDAPAAGTKPVRLLYGRGELEIEVPAGAVVAAPRELPGLADERAAVQAAMRRPTGAAPLR